MKMQRIFSIDVELVQLMNQQAEINWSAEVNNFLKERLQFEDIEKAKQDKALKVLDLKAKIHEQKAKEFRDAFDKRKLTAPLEEFNALKENK